MSRLSEVFADYVLNYSIDNMSKEAIDNAKMFFRDCFGCMLAGSNEEAPKLAKKYVKSLNSIEVASIYGEDSFKTDACSAAMVNGTAAHIHDYDDVSTNVTGHPSVVVLPTALAVGEELKASGKEVLEAYMVGIEVMGLTGRGFNPQHYSKGWHNTATLGVFGSVAAAGKLYKLTKEQLVYAFGIAVSRAAGLKGNFGTMTKSLHAGLAASNGIFAAKLAKIGFDSNPDIMEMDGGFIQVTTGDYNKGAIEEFIASKKSEFTDPGLACKPFPSCKATHNGINAAMAIKDELNFNIDEIESIKVDCQPIAKDLLKYPQAKTPLQGKFSMNYCIACGLVRGKVSLKDFEGDEIVDKDILNVMSKITMEVDEDIAKGEYYNGTWETAVQINLLDGRNLYKRVRYALGDPENPLAKEKAEEKFLDCIMKIVNINNSEKLINDINHIENLEKISDLIDDLKTSLK